MAETIKGGEFADSDYNHLKSVVDALRAAQEALRATTRGFSEHDLLNIARAGSEREPRDVVIPERIVYGTTVLDPNNNMAWHLARLICGDDAPVEAMKRASYVLVDLWNSDPEIANQPNERHIEYIKNGK